MAAVNSTMLPLGTDCPDFDLPDISGEIISNKDYEGQPLLVAFICNHCPFVKHIQAVMTEVFNRMIENGAGVVTISSNNVESHPEDGPDRMKEVAEQCGYQFPYLYDESQEVAKAFFAACTPDFYVFNRHHQLIYRGQFDDSRPNNDEMITGRDVTTAVEAALEDRTLNVTQRPAIGCSIKWKPGNEPEYYQ